MISTVILPHFYNVMRTGVDNNFFSGYIISKNLLFFTPSNHPVSLMLFTFISTKYHYISGFWHGVDETYFSGCFISKNYFFFTPINLPIHFFILYFYLWHSVSYVPSAIITFNVYLLGSIQPCKLACLNPFGLVLNN